MKKLFNKRSTFFILILFLASFQKTHALDVFISEKSLEAYISGEYNRADNYSGSVSFLGDIEFNNLLNLRGGFSFGREGESAELGTFTTLSASFFSGIPLEFSVSWKYCGLFLYETHTNVILPVIKYGTSRAGISAGMSFRFTSFFAESPQFEIILNYLLYYNIIDGPILRFGISIGNYDDFYAKNAAAYTINFNTVVKIDNNWTLLNKVEIMQSGIDGLAVNFYGFSWKGGARFSW